MDKIIFVFGIDQFYTGGLIPDLKWEGVNLNVIENFVSKYPDWFAKFNIWKLVWDENRLIIYLNGVVLHEVD